MFGKNSDKLNKYIDPTGEFSNREFKLSEWYIQHKLTLRKIGLSSLLIFAVATLGYSLLYWGYYFTTGYWQDQQMLNNQVLEIENYDNLKHFYAPKPFAVGSAQIYQTVSPENYDFVVDINNNNTRWLALVEYQFIFNGGETPVAQTVILPGNRPVAYFGFKNPTFPSGAKLVIKNIDWRHLDAHLFPDVKSFMAEHSQWSTDNFKFSHASRITGIPASKIEFTLGNFSPYGFWKANFYVEFLNGGERVGMYFLPEEKFLAQEIRQVDLRSFVTDLYVDDIRIYPLVNVFDSSEYLSVGGEKNY